MSGPLLPTDGERFLLRFEGVIRLEHLHRYYLAREMAEGLDVLDIASGEGYGSDILMARARSVTGVDINSAAISYARDTYERPGLTFIEGSATAIPLSDDAVDLVASFETIEHLTEHDKMLMEIRRVLRPRGFLLISSPNKEIYSDRTGYKNPFHLRELYTHEFISLVKRYFANTRHFGQRTAAASIIASAEAEAPMLIFTDSGSANSMTEARYDVLLASDGPLLALPTSLYKIPDSPLQPEQAELSLASKDAEIVELRAESASKDAEIVELRAESTSKDAEIVELRAESNRLGNESIRLRTALQLLADDANIIVTDKWWKRASFLRRMSNYIRKLRGRPKKVWPTQFSSEYYLSESRSETASPDITNLSE